MSAELIRVLVAIEDPGPLEAVLSALPGTEGYTAERATTARALELLSGGGHDVLVLEVTEPGRVLEVVTLARARAGERPIVLVADPSHEAVALKALRQGCSDYLLKDQLYPVLVRRAIRYAVESCRQERRRAQAERALSESEQRYRSLFQQSRDAIYMTDRRGEIVELNEAALELLGYQPDELLGRDVGVLYADREDGEQLREELDREGGVRDIEMELRRQDGRQIWCLVSAWQQRGPDGEVAGHQAIIHDISARKEMEKKLAHEAFHDNLTGLPNRGLFMDRLERAVARRRRGDERDLAVVFLDLDRFKMVNDSLGHAVGDDMLRQVARLLREEVREEDTVARIGGDEFAILLDGVDEPADPTHVAERIQERLRKPFRVRGHEVFASMSVGITFTGSDIREPEALLRDADTAMYRAKELGPARYQIFDEGMHAHAVSMLQLETDLRLAVDRREFVVHYQPVLDLETDRLTGFEALVRWNHPQRGLLHPQSFIPVAEESGLIIPLGDWVLREATRQLRLWRERASNRNDLFVSVNLSARQFVRADLVDTVKEVLSESGLPGEALHLELTESVVMQNPDAAVRALQRLRDLGVRLCIDDFGTGYSSLNYLHNFPIDTLKIDRSFVGRLDEEDGDGSIVETIIALARNLGMAAIAEGVETERQLERLRTLGPTSVQGFLFSIPLDEQAASALLDERFPLTRR